MTSRPAHEIIAEAERFVRMGYKEVVLTGVLIGAYGPKTGSGGPDFEDLITRLGAIRGLERIRISSIEMRQVTPRLIGLLKSGAVVPHLHIPLQSGDSGVLKDMNRPYTQADYVELCNHLYAAVPDISITTDIMVGFPTETHERFLSTARVCEEVKYLKAHVFRFSPRFGTPADAWGDPVTNEDKTRRSLELASITKGTSERHVQKFIGRTLRVLVEGKLTKEGLLEGLTDNYLSVHFAGPLSLQRETCYVRLIQVKEGAIIGELATEPQRCGRSLLTVRT